MLTQKNTAAPKASGRFHDILKDGLVQLNLAEWRKAIDSGHNIRIDSARAMFVYDVKRRYNNDCIDFVRFTEQVLLADKLAS